MKHIGLDLVRVTEGAAIAASAWVGSGNKELADKAATDSMRTRLNRMDFKGIISIGEGEKDESYGLFRGEKVGLKWQQTKVEDGENGWHKISDPSKIYELAVDPIDGTRPVANSGPEAMSVIAVTEQHAMFDTKEFYMHKLAYGPKIANKIKLQLDWPLVMILNHAAKALEKSIDKLTVCILNRPRHEEFISIMRDNKVRIKLIQDCDVSGAIATCIPDSGVDLLYGIGGAPESVISAAAIKCMRGDFQSIISDNEGNLKGDVHFMEDLVRGPCAFAATGITDGSLLEGVRFEGGRPVTNSIFMRSESGTIRTITSNHGN